MKYPYALFGSGLRMTAIRKFEPRYFISARNFIDPTDPAYLKSTENALSEIFQRTQNDPEYRNMLAFIHGIDEPTNQTAHCFSLTRNPEGKEALAEADVSEVETYIHSTGFFRAKAKDIVAAAKMMVEQYDGKVPDTMEELLKLPGVGRKTANLILGDVYHKPGVVVADTHCIRITGRLGLTDGTKDPVKVEQQLRQVLPPEESNDFCHRMVLHGRAVCMARKPDCPNCTLRPWCSLFTQSQEA